MSDIIVHPWKKTPGRDAYTRHVGVLEMYLWKRESRWICALGCLSLSCNFEAEDVEAAQRKADTELLSLLTAYVHSCEVAMYPAKTKELA